MKTLLSILIALGTLLFFPFSQAQACGHEGLYTGVGYTQLFQYSSEDQLSVPAVTTASKIDWNSRFGGYLKFGYDYCSSRWGIEVPLGFDQQRLNMSEIVNIFTVDVNAVFHILETRGGVDFYWIGGLGGSYAAEGPIEDNSEALGVNLNFGPGFQYFINNGKKKVAAGISIPVRYTLYLGNNLSGGGRTSVLAFPIRVGLTIGF